MGPISGAGRKMQLARAYQLELHSKGESWLTKRAFPRHVMTSSGGEEEDEGWVASALVSQDRGGKPSAMISSAP